MVFYQIRIFSLERGLLRLVLRKRVCVHLLGPPVDVRIWRLEEACVSGFKVRQGTASGRVGLQSAIPRGVPILLCLGELFAPLVLAHGQANLLV